MIIITVVYILIITIKSILRNMLRKILRNMLTQVLQSILLGTRVRVRVRVTDLEAIMRVIANPYSLTLTSNPNL
jgi:hypothetical protein